MALFGDGKRKRLATSPMAQQAVGAAASRDQLAALLTVCRNNLKSVTAEFPLGKFVCVTGVSGGGKAVFDCTSAL